MKKVVVVFLFAFGLNILWENLHVFLYDNNSGNAITQWVLVQASLFDAVLITLILLPFLIFSLLKKKVWLIVVVGIVIAIINEWYGLGTSRWMYNEYMPILPFINTGLTPTIQLGFLGYLTYKLQDKFTKA